MTDTWLILGATSTMAGALGRKLAEQGSSLVLAGRRMDALDRMATDLTERGAPKVECMAFDARDPLTFGPLLEHCAATDGVLNVAVFVGSMPDQDAIDADPALIDGVMADNLSGPAQFLTALAPELEKRGTGTIVGLSSVAGDRGRIGNYVYGAAKAGFTAYLSGLRNRLGRKGVHVLTVKPGPVDTAMTQGMEGLPFMTTPEAVADDILKSVRKRRNVLYTKRIWWPIMMVIRAIPEPIFKKMSI